MRFIVTSPMYNEINHVDSFLHNCIDLDIYDEIIILDDGSTDGTWDVLQQYSSKYNNIHVFRNEYNSIKHHGKNRWMILSELAKEFSPDWINLRAADTIYSFRCKQLIRPRLKELLKKGVFTVSMPWVNVWRSNTWFRSDGHWGDWALGNGVKTIWRYDKNFKWHTNHTMAGMHQGLVMPLDMGHGFDAVYKTAGLNEVKPWDMVILHRGLASHKLIVSKFKSSMEAAQAASEINRSMGMPPPSNMPPVSAWKVYNGYKAFYEFDIKLEKLHPKWYEDVGQIKEDTPPKIESLYSVIKEYSAQRAEEYKILFEYTFKRSAI